LEKESFFMKREIRPPKSSRFDWKAWPINSWLISWLFG
jgi:hypothetical protein